jgi:hypothetical protein
MACLKLRLLQSIPICQRLAPVNTQNINQVKKQYKIHFLGKLKTGIESKPQGDLSSKEILERMVKCRLHRMLPKEPGLI